VTDFAAEGLLDGLEGDARAARERLLRSLHDDGVPLEELRTAADEERLVLLPVERVLERDAKYTPRDIAEQTGLTVDDLRASYRAFGLPPAGDDERLYSDVDLDVARSLREMLDAGIPLERVLELTRVIGRSTAQVAGSSRAMIAEALFSPGLDEHQLATIAATAARELAPKMAPVLGYAYERHLREQLRSDVVNASEVAAGRVAGAQDRAVAFADLVDFTRLGEEIPAEELGAVARRLDELAGERIEQPVSLVKTVGDAVLLVSADTDCLIEASLDLLDAAREEGPTFPQLRVGIAYGPALERAGDWFGSPVNTASRVTGVARAGSVLLTEDARETAEREWSWSYAGERKLKGVGAKKLFRARRAQT
jgi:adenylate cyclase